MRFERSAKKLCWHILFVIHAFRRQRSRRTIDLSVTNPRISEWPMPETDTEALLVCLPKNKITVTLLWRLLPLDKGHFISVFCYVYCHVFGFGKCVFYTIPQTVTAFDEIDAEWECLEQLMPYVDSSVYLVVPVVTEVLEEAQ